MTINVEMRQGYRPRLKECGSREENMDSREEKAKEGQVRIEGVRGIMYKVCGSSNTKVTSSIIPVL